VPHTESDGILRDYRDRPHPQCQKIFTAFGKLQTATTIERQYRRLRRPDLNPSRTPLALNAAQMFGIGAALDEVGPLVSPLCRRQSQLLGFLIFLLQAQSSGAKVIGFANAGGGQKNRKNVV
jgi:hypothetical protein